MAELLKLVTEGTPVPEERIAELEKLVEDCRSGRVTSFVFAAIGPDFAQWQDGHIRCRVDRLTLLGQLCMIQRLLEDQEIESQ